MPGALGNWSLASDAGISPNTAKAWLSILESSYIVYKLSPYHRNFNKRIVKSSKLYFYDTGVVCSLLDIKDEDQVALHYMKGALFENLVINEYIKRSIHRGEKPEIYFWQDSQGKEIDCLLVDGENILPIEIKAGKTMSSGYFANLQYWREIAKKPDDGFVVYGGEQTISTSSGKFLSWRDLEIAPMHNP